MAEKKRSSSRKNLEEEGACYQLSGWMVQYSRPLATRYREKSSLNFSFSEPPTHYQHHPGVAGIFFFLPTGQQKTIPSSPPPPGAKNSGERDNSFLFLFGPFFVRRRSPTPPPSGKMGGAGALLPFFFQGQLYDLFAIKNVKSLFFFFFPLFPLLLSWQILEKKAPSC